MKRLILTLFALTLLASTLSADEVIRCESKGRRRECSFATPGSVIITVRRQLSVTECVHGSNWGWRDGALWVDNGCRADFLIERRREDRRDERRDERRDDRREQRGTRVVCESSGRLRRCDAEIRFGVRVERQLGRIECVRGQNWGWDRDGIWVDHGCRAEFSIDSGSRDRDAGEYRARVTCESRDGRNTICEADTRFGVELLRKLSATECVFRRNWGYNEQGIWVRDGCRAEFLIGRH